MHPVPILMYHSVAALKNPAYDRWCVSPARFAEQLSVLAGTGYVAMTTGDYVDHLERGAALPEKVVIITFDDGLQDFLTGALPILGRFGFGATLYVTAGMIGKTGRWLAPLGEGNRPMLTAEEVRLVAAAGIEIGGHSMTHPELDTLTAAEALDEIGGSRRRLEDILAAPVRSFAYPHGYNSSQTQEIVRKVGYRSAVRVRHALSERNEARYGMSRLIITEDLDASRFLALIEGKGVPVAPPQERLAGRLWRTARRVRRWRDRSAASRQDREAR